MIANFSASFFLFHVYKGEYKLIIKIKEKWKIKINVVHQQTLKKNVIVTALVMNKANANVLVTAKKLVVKDNKLR